MQENTFSKEVTFSHLSFDKDNPTQRKMEPVTKMATFRELNQLDRTQHKMHGRLFAFFATSPFGDNEEEGAKMTLDTDGIYDMTTYYIKNFLVVGEEFGIKDKEKLLSDSTALFDLGIWLMRDKFTPFFLQSRTNSPK